MTPKAQAARQSIQEKEDRITQVMFDIVREARVCKDFDTSDLFKKMLIEEYGYTISFKGSSIVAEKTHGHFPWMARLQ